MRRTSRTVTPIVEGNEESFEEEFEAHGEQGGNRSSVDGREQPGDWQASSVSSSGFVPPTHMSGPPSDKGLSLAEATDGSSGYVPPTHVSGPRSVRKGKGKRGDRLRPSAAEKQGDGSPTSSSGYIPPTHMSGPRSVRKGSKITRTEGKGPPSPDTGLSLTDEDASTCSSGYIPPTRVSGPRSVRKGKGKRTEGPPSPDTGLSLTDEDASTCSSGYIPPTRVSGPRSVRKGRGKRAEPDTGLSLTDEDASTCSSVYVPPTRVSGPPSVRKGKGRRTEENGDAASSSVGATHVTGPGAVDKAIDGKSKTSRKHVRRSIRSSTDAPDQDLNRSLRNLKAGADESAPASTSAPPVAQSVEFLPGVFSSEASNVEMDDMVSTYTGVTAHSQTTSRVRNSSARDDQTIRTTSTTATAPVRNRATNRRASAESLELDARCTAVSSEMNDSNALLHASSGRGLRGQPRCMVINEQGHTMTEEELRVVWERSGKCTDCGLVQTHKKEKYGPFGTLRRMKPLTVEGQCYEGYCLRCCDVHDLRRLLNDHTIPVDLTRHDLADHSMRSLQDHREDGVFEISDKSPIVKLCSSIKFQICMGITLLGIVGALVGLGIIMAKGPDALVSLPPTSTPPPTSATPTSSPTPYEWAVVSELRKDHVDSFGYHVDLSADGLTLAVASPNHDGSRGRLDVYRVVGSNNEWAEVGDAIVGDDPGDDLGFSMSLSGDGSSVAVGSPGHDRGMVKVFYVDPELGLVQKGQEISGPTPMSQFGYAIALSEEGNRLFVSAPQFAVSVNEMYGMIQVFEFDGQEWVPVGSDIVGPSHGSRFGSSISVNDSGTRVAIGAPLDDEKWEDAGQIHLYQLEDGEWVDFLNNKLQGSEETSLFGSAIALTSDGDAVFTGTHDRHSEAFPNAGVVSIYHIDDTFNDANLVGFPLSGTYENAGFGYDVAVADGGEVLIVSGQNGLEAMGTVRIFVRKNGQYMPYGEELFGPDMGTGWYGKGPSVGAAARSPRMAVGYEKVVDDDGVARGVVRIIDYFPVDHSSGYFN